MSVNSSVNCVIYKIMNEFRFMFTEVVVLYVLRSWVEEIETELKELMFKHFICI